jgi:hypothetical protein
VSPIPADQLEPDGARARQLRSDLVAAERQQRREHEREMQVGEDRDGARAQQSDSHLVAPEHYSRQLDELEEQLLKRDRWEADEVRS